MRQSQEQHAHGTKTWRNTSMCHCFNIVLKAYFDYAINEGTWYKGKRRICKIADFTHISFKPQAKGTAIVVMIFGRKVCRGRPMK